MRIQSKASSLILAAALLATMARAQAPDKNAAPKPPDSPSKVLLDAGTTLAAS